MIRRLVWCIGMAFAPLILVRTTGQAQGTESPARAALRSRMDAALRALMADGDTPKAQREFESVAASDPTFAAPRYNLGVLLEQQREWRTAMSWFKQFLALDSTSEYATRARSELLSLQRVDSLWNLPGGPQRVNYADAVTRSRMFIRAGLYRQSVMAAAEAVAVDSTRWEAFGIAASALAQQQSFAEAKEFLDRAQRTIRTPEQTTELNGLAQRITREEAYRDVGRVATAALSAGDYKRAASEYLRAAGMFPERGEYKLAAASAHELLGDSVSAAQLATPLAASGDQKIREQAGALLRRLSLFGANADGRSVSLSTARAPVDAAPVETPEQSARRQHDTAIRFMDERKWAEAATAYRAALKGFPKSAMLYAGLGDALAGELLWTEAAIEYGTAIKYDPENPDYWHSFGQALLFAGRKLESIAALEEALRLAPTDTRIRANLERAKKSLEL